MPEINTTPLTARQKHMVKRCINLARKFVSDRSERLELFGVNRDEALSFAFGVLTEAARTYDPDKGKPSTHFMAAMKFQFMRPSKIRGWVIDLPQYLFDRSGKKKRGMARDDPDTYRGLPVAHTLTDLVDDDDTDFVESMFFVSNADPVEEAARNEEHANSVAKVEDLLRHLNDPDQDIIARRYGLRDYLPHQRWEIGAVYGISHQRVHQIEVRALRRLMKAAKGNSNGKD